MKPINWLQFTWDLTALPQLDSELPEHYQIDVVTAEDEKEVRRVISSSFALDPNWNPAMKEVMETIEPWLEHAADAGKSTCLALRHGARIIGAAIVSLEPAAENHLSPGPCILIEYRNRGLGTNLLHRSLAALRDAGVPIARAIGRENSPVAKFLYSKFQSVQTPQSAAAELAA
ncbi:MAG: GNAT family N-acetyltransferase [Chthoniobacterales bacterium]